MIYLLSAIRYLQELGKILANIEGLISIRHKRDLTSILKSIMSIKPSKKVPKSIQPEHFSIYMRSLEFEYFKI